MLKKQDCQIPIGSGLSSLYCINQQLHETEENHYSVAQQ